MIKLHVREHLKKLTGQDKKEQKLRTKIMVTVKTEQNGNDLKVVTSVAGERERNTCTFQLNM